MINIAYNVDCMEYMRTLPDKAFTLAVVDPPYGLPKGSTKGQGKLKNRSFNKGNVQRWDIPPSPEYFQELMRVSENQVIWGVIISNCRLAGASLCGTNYSLSRILAGVNTRGRVSTNPLNFSHLITGVGRKYIPRKNPWNYIDGYMSFLPNLVTKSWTPTSAAVPAG